MAVARMERRHTRRLLRYWVFLAIAYLLGFGGYVYYSGLHAFFSSISASAGMISPRYLVGAIGLYYLAGFVLGIVFLGFDVRARDIREGIVEVLDSRPLTNLELVAGRFVALFLCGWLPIVFLALLMQGLGWLLPLLGSPIGATIEPYSLFYFVVPMAVPAIALAIALVFVITLSVRHRLLAALISIAVFVTALWALFTTSATYAPWMDFLGMTQAAFPSDLVPAMTVAGGWAQRLGVLALAFGLLALAAAVHPRLDGGTRARPVTASAALVLLGVLGLALSAQQFLGEARQIDHWRAAHEARAGEPAAAIVAIAGSVGIEPGRRLDAELGVELAAPADRALERVLLTLNPGFTVTDVRVDGRALGFEHVDGLLDVALERPLPAGERLSLALAYGGRPDMRFGYLDSSMEVERLTVGQAQVGILGYERGIFDRRYVALTPAVHWLPAAGVDVGRDDPRQRATDYFELELEVELPASWLAAGPGRRQPLSAADGRAGFRFAPAVRVPEVALMASRFRHVATEIDGITFEVMLHPGHSRNLDVLAEARAEIEEWVAERLEVAAAAGLAYPFDAFTIVEVPNRLRAFRGGWRLDTALAPPAMMLLRESSLPTARFDVDVVAMFGSRNVEQEGGAARVMRNRLVNFFTNDLSGGNLFAGAARSFFAHRTSAVGDGAIALDFVLEELSTLLVSGRRSYFSAHLFTNINQAVVGAVSNLGGNNTVADSMINTRTTQPGVWEVALDTSLAGLDPWDNPERAIDLLTLKGGEMAQALHDALGPEGVGALLADLLEHHAGGTFTLADFLAAGARSGAGLDSLFEDWVGSSGLPGFVTESTELYRLPDAPDGASRYQMLLRLSNAEPVVGFARVAWVMQPGGARTFSQPIRLAGHSTVEFGTVLSAPPFAVFVHPYLSLNRGAFMAAMVGGNDVARRDGEPFGGLRDVPFGTGRDARIFADDLDAGFAIVTAEGGSAIRLVGREDGRDDASGRAPANANLDQGLPIGTGVQPPRRWSRRSVESAWGRYRHTFAYVGSGDGTRRAILPAQIPSPGVWGFEIHMPFLPFLPPNARGTWHLEIVSDAGREPVAFDASIASTGWNLVGQYRLPAGEVRVEFTDRTDGRMVIADAVAWSPVRLDGQADETDMP